MEGLAAGFGTLFTLFCLIGALVILSIAIDASRSIRRANRIIALLEEQNRYLAAISTDIAKAALGEQKRVS